MMASVARSALAAVKTMLSKSSTLQTMLGLNEANTLAAIVAVDATSSQETADSGKSVVLTMIDWQSETVSADRLARHAGTFLVLLTIPRPGTDAADDFGDALDWEDICQDVRTAARSTNYDVTGATLTGLPVRMESADPDTEFMAAELEISIEAYQ